MEVKGAAVVVFRRFLSDRFGDEAVGRWLEALPRESRLMLEPAVDINRWYPLREALLEPTEAVCRVFYGGDPKGAWELGRQSAEYALTGMYRSLVKLSPVKFYVERGGVMITNYYRPCRSQTVSVEDGRALVRISEFPESHELIEGRIAGWMQKALEVRGCREVRIEIPRSLARGDPDTDFLLIWE